MNWAWRALWWALEAGGALAGWCKCAGGGVDKVDTFTGGEDIGR